MRSQERGIWKALSAGASFVNYEFASLTFKGQGPGLVNVIFVKRKSKSDGADDAAVRTDEGVGDRRERATGESGRNHPILAPVYLQ
jgi:hypothetical protein